MDGVTTMHKNSTALFKCCFKWNCRTEEKSNEFACDADDAGQPITNKYSDEIFHSVIHFFRCLQTEKLSTHYKTIRSEHLPDMSGSKVARNYVQPHSHMTGSLLLTTP